MSDVQGFGGPIPPRLRAVTVEIPDPGPLTALLPRRDAVGWVRDGEGFVGWGEAARHKPAGTAEADDWWSDLVAATDHRVHLDDPPAGAGLLAFGSFPFDPDNSAVAAAFVVPRTVVGRRRGRAWRTTVAPEGVDGADDGAGHPPAPRAPRGVSFADGALSGPQWVATVAEAVRRISAGGLDKVVLARDLLALADEDLDPRWLVQRLAKDYPLCWTYLVDGLVGATPEMLVRREGGLVTSRVLAGTIRRTGQETGDLALAAGLAHSNKDLEEHRYAVRSVARGLAPFCSGMHVPDAPYVLELPNVLHLATDVTAAARTGASALALAGALHPSAAVCGTPTDLARETIAELEHLDRERYAGPVGWLDAAGDGEWGIALRCGQLSETDPRQIRLFAGCGVVAGSDPEAELAEAVAKFVPMRDALGE